MQKVSLATTLLALAATPALGSEHDTADLCAEAEERYVDLFGQPSSEVDGVTVVKMYEYSFCPKQITIPAGTTVRWVNVDKRTSHSVLSPDAGIPETDRVFPEEHVEITFPVPGPVDYLCGPHWETRDMVGMVTVTE